MRPMMTAAVEPPVKRMSSDSPAEQRSSIAALLIISLPTSFGLAPLFSGQPRSTTMDPKEKRSDSLTRWVTALWSWFNITQILIDGA